MNRIEFNKYIDERNYKTFILKRDDNKEFIISFQGNLDLYFSLNNFDDEPYFIIDKSNYIIYELFDKLYNDIKKCNIFDEQKINKDHKKRYEYKKLFNNSIIEWKSDDYPDEIAPSFKIIKEKDYYLITFNPLKEDKDFDYYIEPQLNNWISIRIRNSGSKYSPFNIIFMKLYNSLCNINKEDLEQVHIQEYLLEKRKKLTK